MGDRTKNDQRMPLRKLATAFLVMAVTIGGIGATEAAALWRRLGSSITSSHVNDVQVCRDGIVVDVVASVNWQLPDDQPIGEFVTRITVATEWTENGSVDDAVPVVADRPLFGSDAEFRYLTAVQLPQGAKEALGIPTSNDNTVVRYHFGRFVLPFYQLQDVGTELFIDSPRFEVEEAEERVVVANCRIWPHVIGSFIAKLFNGIARALGLGNQGIQTIPFSVV